MPSYSVNFTGTLSYCLLSTGYIQYYPKNESYQTFGRAFSSWAYLDALKCSSQVLELLEQVSVLKLFQCSQTD